MKRLFPLLLLVGLIQSFSLAQSAAGNSPTCPTIRIENVSSASSKLNKKNLLVFKVGAVKGFDVSTLGFRWFNSGGKIISGQGTPELTLDPEKFNDIVVKVEVFGLPQNCPNKGAAATHWDPSPQAVKIDEIRGSSTPAKKVNTTRTKTRKRLIRKTPNKFTSH